MARLVHPSDGTVVELDGDLEVRYRALGWGDVEKPKTAKRAPVKKPDLVTE